MSQMGQDELLPTDEDPDNSLGEADFHSEYFYFCDVSII